MTPQEELEHTRRWMLVDRIKELEAALGSIVDTKLPPSQEVGTYSFVVSGYVLRRAKAVLEKCSHELHNEKKALQLCFDLADKNECQKYGRCDMCIETDDCMVNTIKRFVHEIRERKI